MNAATVLVTGAAGFIGSHLVEELSKRGYTVVGIDNFDPFYPRTMKEANLKALSALKSFEFFEMDIRDGAGLKKLAREFKITDVIHLAGRAGVRPSVKDPAGYMDVNATATISMMEALRQEGVNRFVLGSSSSVYGDSAPVPFVETDPCIAPISPYASSKRAMELGAHALYITKDVSSLCLRLFTVYGPRQRPDLAIRSFCDKIYSRKPIEVFGDLNSARDYTYVTDTVQGLVSGLEWLQKQSKPVFELINLGNSKPINLAELISTIEKELDIPAVRESKPRQKGDVMRTWASCDKAKMILGYRPSVSFSAGIAKFVDWFKAQI